MNAVLPLPVVLPLLGAALSIMAFKSRRIQRVISLAVLSSTAAISIVLLLDADRDGPVVAQMGGWPAPFGITLIADRLAGIMLAVAAVMLISVLVYAIGQPGAERNHGAFHPVYLVLSAGVAAAFLTGDLFNLFVAFEMMLTASYVLLTLGGGREQIRSGMTYVVISLVASALFLTSLALIYSATGTVNMAQLAERMDDLPDGVRLSFGLLLLVVFGIKAALFPLFSWLPDSYPTAPSPITAVFAGLLTKVGVYAIIRTQMLFGDPTDRPGTLILVVASITMVVGVLGAIAQDDIPRILSFHIVSQIGYMIMGLGLFTVAGLAGALLYVIHHIIVKTTLFLVAGLVEVRAGSGRLKAIGGVARAYPVLGVLFLLPALSLAGLPPFSGFVAKFALVEAGLSSSEYVVVGVSILVSLLTLFSMTKIWGGAFWGEVQFTEEAADPESPPKGLGVMYLSVSMLVVLSLVVALFAGPLYNLSERAAEELLNPEGYVSEVLG
ncbi:MAG: Na+/H+ antiporter subunit D [Microthrixaceae bacterium]|nr:Na+/H+ antiporter subunit D [Microthrixaceae bacterium]